RLSCLRSSLASSCVLFLSVLIIPPSPRCTLFPYTTLFRSPPCRSTICLHIAKPIPVPGYCAAGCRRWNTLKMRSAYVGSRPVPRSEEHTSELQSRENLVCRLLLEKKKNTGETTQTEARTRT